MRALVLVVLALVLTLGAVLGLRRAVLCPLSTGLGLAVGAAWLVVVLVH